MQDFVCEGGVGGKVEDIALAALDNLVGELAADDGAEGVDDFEDGAAAAGAEVNGLDAGLLLAEVVEGNEVALGEVEHVDIVADGGAVPRRVV